MLRMPLVLRRRHTFQWLQRHEAIKEAQRRPYFRMHPSCSRGELTPHMTGWQYLNSRSAAHVVDRMRQYIHEQRHVTVMHGSGRFVARVVYYKMQFVSFELTEVTVSESEPP